MRAQWWLKDLIGRHIHRCPDCQRINKDSSGKDRVGGFNSAAPGCGCESCRSSQYSQGPIENEEVLTRFAFSPYHFDKKKPDKVLSSLFDHAFNRGCSIQREQATNEELIEFVESFLKKNEQCVWRATFTASAEEVRQQRLDNSTMRPFCIYDTAEKTNPSHAEIMASEFDEADRVELRNLLFDVFKAKTLATTREQYRDGKIYEALSSSLKSRPITLGK